MGLESETVGALTSRGVEVLVKGAEGGELAITEAAFVAVAVVSSRRGLVGNGPRLDRMPRDDASGVAGSHQLKELVAV